MILLCKTEMHSSFLILTPTNPTRALLLTHVVCLFSPYFDFEMFYFEWISFCIFISRTNLTL
jgi:hypothetical protein